jgi:hypothetical protein
VLAVSGRADLETVTGPKRVLGDTFYEVQRPVQGPDLVLD